jgi:hypothetical protein
MNYAATERVTREKALAGEIATASAMPHAQAVAYWEAARAAAQAASDAAEDSIAEAEDDIDEAKRARHAAEMDFMDADGRLCECTAALHALQKK